MTALARVQSMLEQRRHEIFAAAVDAVDPERFSAMVLTAVAKQPKLASCSAESWVVALQELATLNLPPVGGRAHLIPYGPSVKVVIGWQGLADLAMRSGDILKLESAWVYSNDDFVEQRGTTEVFEHRPARGNRGQPECVYSLAHMRNGSVTWEVMSIDEVEEIRGRSDGYQYAIRKKLDNPWLSDFSEMGRKTATRRHTKRLPMSADVIDRLDALDAAEFAVHRIATTATADAFSPVQTVVASSPELTHEADNDDKLSPDMRAGLDWCRANFARTADRSTAYRAAFLELCSMPDEIAAPMLGLMVQAVKPPQKGGVGELEAALSDYSAALATSNAPALAAWIIEQAAQSAGVTVSVPEAERADVAALCMTSPTSSLYGVLKSYVTK